MIKDLTKEGVFTPTKSIIRFRSNVIRFESTPDEFAEASKLVLTGDRNEREEKRAIYLEEPIYGASMYYCQRCGKEYYPIPWRESYNFDICDKCYNESVQRIVENVNQRSKMRDSSYFKLEKLSTTDVDRTQRILDLWNRSY